MLIIWLLDKIFLITSLLIAIIIHEYSHGWVAEKLGDPTAREAGRLSFNPIVHIDLIGTVILPISMLIISGGNFAFGWAKPIPVNPYLLNNPKKDMLKVASAGIAANFIIATGAAMILRLGGILPIEIFELIARGKNLALNPFLNFLAYLILINLLLGIFNLMPIPPLDGSQILQSLLPRDMAWKYKKIEPYGIILVFLFIFFLFDYVILPLIYFIITLYSLH